MGEQGTRIEESFLARPAKYRSIPAPARAPGGCDSIFGYQKACVVYSYRVFCIVSRMTRWKWPISGRPSLMCCCGRGQTFFGGDALLARLNRCRLADGLIDWSIYAQESLLQASEAWCRVGMAAQRKEEPFSPLKQRKQDWANVRRRRSWVGDDLLFRQTAT